MLSPPATAEERVTTAHRAKLAYIYVRQSGGGGSEAKVSSPAPARFGTIRRAPSCSTD
jgi:hypothetical protein